MRVMFKTAEVKRRRYAPPKGVKAYVRFTPRLLYINSDAMKMLGETETVSISINAKDRVMMISPGGEWKLTSVCESKYARRIENGNNMMGILEAGFPKGMVGHYLHCYKGLGNVLIVSLIPDYEEKAV